MTHNSILTSSILDGLVCFYAFFFFFTVTLKHALRSNTHCTACLPATYGALNSSNAAFSARGHFRSLVVAGFRAYCCCATHEHIRAYHTHAPRCGLPLCQPLLSAPRRAALLLTVYLFFVSSALPMLFFSPRSKHLYRTAAAHPASHYRTPAAHLSACRYARCITLPTVAWCYSCLPTHSSFFGLAALPGGTARTLAPPFLLLPLLYFPRRSTSSSFYAHAVSPLPVLSVSPDDISSALRFAPYSSVFCLFYIVGYLRLCWRGSSRHKHNAVLRLRRFLGLPTARAYTPRRSPFYHLTPQARRTRMPHRRAFQLALPRHLPPYALNLREHLRFHGEEHIGATLLGLRFRARVANALAFLTPHCSPALAQFTSLRRFRFCTYFPAAHYRTAYSEVELL